MFSYDVAFWNVNMGPKSAELKRQTFANWCKNNKPDLLFLEEDAFLDKGAEGRDQLEKLSGLKYLGHVNTLDVNDEGTGKNIVALVQAPLQGNFQCRDVRFAKQAIRMALKVTRSGLEIYGIHANASGKGGNAAADAADLLTNRSGTVVGGDFNHPLGQEPAWQYFRPKAWSYAFGSPIPYLFTQWNDRGTRMPKTVQEYEALMLLFHDPVINKTLLNNPIKPFNILDYAICSNDITAKPISSLYYDDWKSIINMFDHGPVMYKFQK